MSRSNVGSIRARAQRLEEMFSQVQSKETSHRASVQEKENSYRTSYATFFNHGIKEIHEREARLAKYPYEFFGSVFGREPKQYIFSLEAAEEYDRNQGVISKSL